MVRVLLILFGGSLLILLAVLLAVRSTPLNLTWLVYTSERPGGDAIYLMSTEDRQAHPLTPPDEDACCARFSPDGSWIVYYSFRDGQLHLMRPDGMVHRTLPRMADRAVNARWTTDGNWLVFFGERNNRDGTASGGLYRVRVDGRSFETLVQDTGSTIPIVDGEYLIYSAGEQIYRVDMSSTDRAQLTSPGTDYRSPALSRDGMWLAYLVQDGASQIMRMHPDGSDATPVGRPFNNICCLSWSPDNRWIIFSIREPGSPWQLVRIGMDGQRIEPLIASPNSINDWDGEWMIIERLSSTSNLDLYRLNAETKILQRLTSHPGSDHSASVGRLSEKNWHRVSLGVSGAGLLIAGLFFAGVHSGAFARTY